MKTVYKNPFFDPPASYSTPNLENYLAATKSDILRLSDTPSNFSTNVSTAERKTLDSLRKRRDIVITSADKGGKIVVLDKNDYLKECTKQLENQEFYRAVYEDPTTQLAEEIENEMKAMEETNLIGKKEFHLLTEFLAKPRIAIFYGLPKIHKSFVNFPPLRPIVSGFSSYTSRLSEFVDTFLKYQAKKCKSYLRDTKDFLQKLQNFKTLPDNAILVTMDVSSLYTNIDHDEGANACYEMLERRVNKTVGSSLLKKLILLVFQIQ